ncbi:MAG: hypothetical protein U0174_12595 [Polyangiaceae bacterium]
MASATPRVFLKLLDDADVRRRPPAKVSEGTIRRSIAIAEALFQTETGPVDAARLAWLEGEFRSFLGHAGPWARFLAGACSRFTTILGPLLTGTFRSFNSLSTDERLRVLERLEASPFALVLLGIKTMLCILYYEQPDAAAEIGFDGLCKSGRERA